MSGIEAPSVPIVEWQGCYDDSWRGEIVPAAFAHPAKMARGLVTRIYDELFAMGAIQRGSRVVDPFGGIGTTGIEGALRGVQVFACELEAKFVALGQQNIELHRRRWTALQRPIPHLVQGDSRQLRVHLASVMAEAVISSPPYAEGLGHGGNREANPILDEKRLAHGDYAYGRSTGQLAAMPTGFVDAVVSSPPFASGDSASAQSMTTRTDKSAAWVKANCGSAATEGYGSADGQLGVMPMGAVADALVSSPPWEKGAEGTVRASKFKDPEAFARGMSANDGHGTRNGTTSESRLAQLHRQEAATYGEAEGQIGNQSGDTFWHAARAIVAESYAILKPGGIAVWVVKHYVKKGRRVDFPGEWRRLCEHVGFETIQEVHASLVETTTTATLFGEATKERARKSFFRRLAEKKGSPRIDFETVWFMRKPSAPSAIPSSPQV